MEMAHEKELATMHKEAVATDHKRSVSEDDGIPKVIRSPPLPCFSENTEAILLVEALRRVAAPAMYL